MSESIRTAPTVQRLMRRCPVTLSPDMDVRAAADALAAADAEAAPVVDAIGRCVGLFTAGDYRWWLTAAPAATDVFSEGQMVAPADRVCDHMLRRFATAAPEADVPELPRRSSATAEATRAAIGPATSGHALYLDP